MNTLKKFKNKKVFITGHTGFKGTWLCQSLIEAGAEVAGYALPPEGNNHFETCGLPNLLGAYNHYGDIRDLKNLQTCIKEFQPEIVFHLAAQAIVRDSYNDPVYNYETNVMGAVNLMEAVRHCESVKSLVVITSDKCYENHEWVWGYRETDELGGHDPYSSSKACVELIFSSYHRSFFQGRKEFGMASARAGNVIGGGDWSKDRIIPDCARTLLQNHTLSLRSPEATRPWQHVLEPLSGYLELSIALLEDPKRFEGAWNFGPNTDVVYTVNEVAQYFKEFFKTGTIQFESDPNQVKEATLLQLNCDKAKQILKWQPNWGVEKSLEATASWYLNYHNNPERIVSFTIDQIKEFFKEGQS